MFTAMCLSWPQAYAKCRYFGLFHLGLGFFCGMQPLNWSPWEPGKIRVDGTQVSSALEAETPLSCWPSQAEGMIPKPLGLFPQDGSQSRLPLLFSLLVPSFEVNYYSCRIQRILKSIGLSIFWFFIKNIHRIHTRNNYSYSSHKALIFKYLRFGII